MATELAVTNVGNAVGSLIDAFLAVAKVAAPMFAGLTGGLTSWAATFDAKVQAVAANGKLQTWIQNGINRFVAFKNEIVKFVKDIELILKNVAGIKLSIFNDLTPAIIPILTAVSKFVKDNPNLAVWILGIAIAIKILSGIVRAITPIIEAFDLVLDANPITLIIVAIAALVVAFVALWVFCKPFRDFWINLWREIQVIVGAVVGV